MKKIFVILFSISTVLLSACGGGVRVDAAPAVQVDLNTGEVISTVMPEPDSGGETFFMAEMPNEDAMRDFLACEQTKVAASATKAANSVIRFMDGTERPAIAISCGNEQLGDGSATLMSANTILMKSAPINTKILGWVYVIGVGLYATVVFAEAIESSGISVNLSFGSGYTQVPLPSFSTFNSGGASPTLTYTATSGLTLNAYGDLATGIETVYVYTSAPSAESKLLGVISSGQEVYYITTTIQNADAYWTMSAADWYEILGLARIAGSARSISADALSATYPEISWPAWDPEAPGWQHAADSREWPILGIMLAYEAIMHSADQVYFSPTRMRIIIGTYDPYLGFIGQIFSTGTVPVIGDLLPESTLSPGNLSFDRPMTILFLGTTRGKFEQMRISGCYSVRVIPLPTEYNPMYDPPSAINPTGIGRCLINNNN